MKKNLFKRIITSLILFSFVVLPAISIALPASATAPSLWGSDSTKRNISQALGYGTSDPEDPRLIAAYIINIFLGFLGIIALALIIWAGFTWMTAGGNEEKIETAQKTLKAAVIGLIIIFAAWGIAYFVVGTAQNATVR